MLHATYCYRCCRTLGLIKSQFSVLTALCALEPASAQHSKSEFFLCSRLLAAFPFPFFNKPHYRLFCLGRRVGK